MFQGFKRVRFENKVDEFRNFITEECKSYHMKEFGTLDEMFCVKIYKFLDKNGTSVDAEVNDDRIIIYFPKNVIHDNSISVTYSNDNTIVTSMNNNFDMDIIEMDFGNDDQIFSKYIDLFMNIYNK